MSILAVLAAASTLVAQDTMTVRSYRTVDICSNERRWQIAPYLGAIKLADSLASFDISIGYDTTLLRPTDVLTEGTLSLQFESFKAQMTLVVPGEIRVFGGDVINFAVGDKPIVVIAGEFRGTCTDIDSLSITWPPTFNNEFKKIVTVFKKEPIQAVANPKNRPDIGVRFKEDSITVVGGVGKKSTTQLDVVMNGLSDRYCTLYIEVADSTIATIDTVLLESSLEPQYERLTKGSMNIMFKQKGSEIPKVAVVLSSQTPAERKETSFKTKMNFQQACECIRPILQDTMRVICLNPMVSVNELSADAHTVNLQVSDELATCQCDHGQMNEIATYSISGLLISSTGQQLKEETFLNLAGLSHGAYIIVGSCGSKRLMKMKLK